MNCIINAWGKHEAELRGFLTRQSGNPAQAEDILQETFLRAVAEGAGFCSLENPRAWLFRVARNQFIDQTRKAETKNRSSDIPDDFPDDVTEIPVIKTLDVCLPKVLAKMDIEDREAIERCDLEGMLQAQFAEEKGLTLAGAKSRVQRARKRLKSELIKLCKVNFDETGNVCCFTSKDVS
jgi:RNA polymerase sigma-70 factor (ECF subfamily)